MSVCVLILFHSLFLPSSLLLSGVRIGLQHASVTVMEGDGVATLAVMVLSGNLDRNVLVNFTTGSDTATGEM